MGERLRLGITVMFLLAGLIFLGLVARVAYLGTSMEEIIARGDLEVDVVYLYTPPEPGGQSNQAVPRQVRVPSLAGKTFAEAGKSLQGTGLLIEGQGDVRGKIVRQEPAPGKAVPEGTAVRVFLTR